MCGITGFFDFKGNTSLETLQEMVAPLHHRGPDDRGVELLKVENCVVGLGHTRLSIIDLSKSGHQPMMYKHLMIVYNGEIYNYKEIRSELIKRGHFFSTQTDTEVILHSFEEWGVKSVDYFIGMFAFVIYDKSNKKAYAFRDRAGVKPFYYYQTNNLFLFGSELKAIMVHPEFVKDINPAVLPNYFHYGYIAAPYTIFKNTYKLMPGHFLEFDIQKKEITLNKYWDLKTYYLKPKLTQEYNEIKEELKTLMRSAFEYRMVADVPVGVFLSGGYDSTAVAALLQSKSSRTLKTFTIGFEEGNNEAPFAKRIANFLGTDHTEYICTTKEAQEIIQTLPFFYDEPFGDSSAIPTILVSNLARKEVTVALSADGGDELFGGYHSYFLFSYYLNKINKVPPVFRKAAYGLSQILKRKKQLARHHLSHKMASALSLVGNEAPEQAANLFRAMAEKPQAYIDNIFSKKFDIVLSSFDIDTIGFKDPLEIAMYIDYNSYLPNDVLTKVDRATMSVSLEGREPLLDHRLAAYVAQIPLKYKTNGKSGKKVLKDILHEYVPKELMDRPKTGFSIPIYSWLRGDLSFLIHEYLSKEALAESGLFDVEFLIGEIKKFKERRLHYSPIIWYLLMFQMWYKKWM